MVAAVPMVIGFFIYNSILPYDFSDIAIGTIVSFLYLMGALCIGKSLQTGGKGGPI